MKSQMQIEHYIYFDLNQRCFVGEGGLNPPSKKSGLGRSKNPTAYQKVGQNFDFGRLLQKKVLSEKKFQKFSIFPIIKFLKFWPTFGGGGGLGSADFRLRPVDHAGALTPP